MEKKHAKHRTIPSSIINHSFYKSLKAVSKNPSKFNDFENTVIGGLHAFEWIVIVLVGTLLIGAAYLGISAFARIGGSLSLIHIYNRLNFVR